MPATVKVNLAVWGAVAAIVISVGGVLVGAGVVVADQRNNRKDIDHAMESIESTKKNIRAELNRIQDQMREDKAELLQAIRSN